MRIDNPIMGIKTKACINGVYPDTIPTIQQNIANIEDDIDDINTELDNVVHKTGDEEIGGEKTFTDDLTVHGEEQNRRGTIVLSPVTQGGIVQLKDVMNRSISIVQKYDTNDHCYLMEYPDNYYPVDENENPVAPSNATIMTSGLVAVDPRIVHTTGNETITGNKVFKGYTFIDKPRFKMSEHFLSPGEWRKYYEYTPVSYGGYVILNIIQTYYIFAWRNAEIRIRQGSTTSNMDGNMYNFGNTLLGCLAKRNDGVVEIWFGNPSTSSSIGVRLNVVSESGGDVIVSQSDGSKPVVGDTYTYVYDMPQN